MNQIKDSSNLHKFKNHNDFGKLVSINAFGTEVDVVDVDVVVEFVVVEVLVIDVASFDITVVRIAEGVADDGTKNVLDSTVGAKVSTVIVGSVASSLIII